jgi:hypothetical protein
MAAPGEIAMDRPADKACCPGQHYHAHGFNPVRTVFSNGKTRPNMVNDSLTLPI